MKRLATSTLAVLLLDWMMTVSFADEPQFKTRAMWIDPPSFSSAKAADEMLARCARGGNILWTDVPAKSLASSPALQKLTGLAATHWMGGRRIALQAARDHPLAQALSGKPFRTESLYGSRLQGAEVIAKLDSGEPAMMLNEMGKGRVVVLGFHLMKSTSPAVVSLAKGIVNWFKTDAGVTGPDALGAKRAEWLAWRGERVTQLVRDISIAAKQKNPRLLISSSVVRHHGSSTLATATRAAGSPRESTIRYFL